MHPQLKSSMKLMMNPLHLGNFIIPTSCGIMKMSLLLTMTSWLGVIALGSVILHPLPVSA